ncbi:hypothetical protein ACUXVY_20575 [Chromobacterium haemolyticum]|uniref:hypothetical protein n=1 Tax=Chromobacterium haemolyticum TaxID=394935 RepID=UPI004055F920
MSIVRENLMKERGCRMIAHMNPRQFKKLCAKAHALVIKINPLYARCSWAPSENDMTDYTWHAAGVLKGTKGFGGVDASMDGSEWWDKSAWAALQDVADWHYIEWVDPDPNDEMASAQPVPNADLQPRSWRDYLVLGELMLLEKGGE